MEQKVVQLFNRGMNRDKSISKADTEFAFDNHNIRILARDHDTMLSVTNERGNKEVENLEFNGILIGWNVLNEYIILFTVDDTDSYIYRVKYENGEFTSIIIFKGALGFDAHHPIESIVDYENENIQKIYWLDGINILRSLNFSDSYLAKHATEDGYDFDPTWFDSNRGAASIPTVAITKTNDGNKRQNGVIQYMLTYYNKNGVQTGVIWNSPLVYLAQDSGSVPADGFNSNQITFTISNLDRSYEYVRIYAILRTSYDVTNSAFLVGDVAITSDTITFVDAGNTLEPIDVTSLLYLGSKEVVASTFTHKDGTLFLGDLKSIGIQDLNQLESSIKTYAFTKQFVEGSVWESGIVSFEYTTGKDNIPYVQPSGLYPYNSQLKYLSSEITTFKGGEKYRFALRFLKGNGDASKAFWIGDKVNPLYPKITSNATIQRAVAVCRVPEIILEKASELGYTSVQLMVAEALYTDRSIKAQGIVSPTLFNLLNRFNNSPYSQSSWMYRPHGGKYANIHFETLHRSDTVTAELQNSWWSNEVGAPSPMYITDANGEIVNKAFSHTEYDYIQVEATINAQKVFVKYWGTLTIKYYIDDPDDPGTALEVPEARKTYSLGLSTALGEKSRLAFIDDWLEAYEDSNVPVLMQAPVATIEAKLTEAYNDATLVQPGSAAPYKLSDPGPAAMDYSTNNSNEEYSRNFREYFFVDSNIVTLNSPEIEYEAVDVDRNSGLKFRIVGAARITGNISDYNMEAEDFEYPGDRTVELNLSTPTISDNIKELTARPLYSELDIEDREAEEEEQVLTGTPKLFMTYMWHKAGSIPEATYNEKKISVLKNKRFANMFFSYYTVYNNYLENEWAVTPSDVRQFNSLAGQLYELTTGGDKKLYSANVDDVVVMPVNSKYPVFHTDDYGTTSDILSLKSDVDSDAPIQVTYDSRAHAVISLPGGNGTDTILPYLFDSEKYNVDAVDDTTAFGPYIPWKNINDISDKMLMYRVCTSEDDLDDISVGRYSTFENREKDSNYISLTKGFDSGSTFAELRAVLDKIRKADVTAPVYVMTLVRNTDNTTQSLLVDFTRAKLTGVNVTVEVKRKFSDAFDKLIFTVESSGTGISAVSYTASALLNGTQFASVSDTVSNSSTYSNKYQFEALIPSISLPSPSLQFLTYEIGMTITFYGLVPSLAFTGADKITIDFNSITSSLDYITTKDKNWYFELEKAKYLSPAITGGSLDFVNLFDNRLISVSNSEYAVGISNYGNTYNAPDQSPFKLNTKDIKQGDQYVFIGELYMDYDNLSKKDISLDTRYGGISESAVNGNRFIPAGNPVVIKDASQEDTYAMSIIDCTALYEQIIDSLTTNDVDILINKYTDQGVVPEETIHIAGLTNFNVEDTLPASGSEITLKVVPSTETEGEYVTASDDLTSTQIEAISESGDYRIIMSRLGYARRGKWRKYINKYGQEQTSHTCRDSNFRKMRCGYSNSLQTKRLRFIGQDLTVAHSSSAWKANSNTWQEHDFVTYTEEMCMTTFGSRVVLPDPDNTRARITRDNHIANMSRDGLCELYIALYHKEGNSWKRVSNLVHVRGRNADCTELWEFDESNVVLSTVNG